MRLRLRAGEHPGRGRQCSGKRDAWSIRPDEKVCLGIGGLGTSARLRLPDTYGMLPKLLLVLFPLLVLFDTRVGFAVLAIAIVLLYTGRVKSTK